MRTHTKDRDGQSGVSMLTELAVESTSSLVEAQRTLLNLAQQENDIVCKGVKDRIGGFLPGVAMTDLVRRSVDTLIEMQQQLLSVTSKQTLHWLESEKTGKGERAGQVVTLAREAVETFTHAQTKFLDVVLEEATTAMKRGEQHEHKHLKKTEIAELAQQAGNAFIEAQKRLLDVAGQQLNVNLDLATRGLETISPAKLMPMANLTGESVKHFVDSETSLIGSLIKPSKKTVKRARVARARATRPDAVKA